MFPEPIETRYASLEQLRSEFALLDDRSLNIVERQELGRWKDPSRREAWILGRLLCKRLIQDHLDDRTVPFGTIEIRSRDDRDRGIRPRVRIAGELQPWALSISHSDHGILVALSDEPGALLGIDLSPIGVFRPSFLRTWFTEHEQVWLMNSEPEQVAVAWSIKEAVYKAANIGDSFAPRSIELFRKPADGYGCLYRGINLSDVCDIQTWLVDGQAAATALLRRPHRAAQNGEAASMAFSHSVGS
jgi:phosphopantetheinyl transferase